MIEWMRTKLTVMIVLNCWLAWGLAITDDYGAKRWEWVAASIICPPAGIARGIYLYSSR